jgi:uncharacterized protein (DUF433 family)
MNLEDYFNFEKFDTPHGIVERIRLNGTRVSIDMVLEYYQAGHSPERIRQQLPSLTLEQVYATITYYLHDQAGVERYLEQGERIAQAHYEEYLANLPPVVQRLKAAKAEREAAQKQS